MLSPQQNEVFIKFLDRLDDYMSNKGCNDLILPNTLENRMMVNEACVWNCRGDNAKEEAEEMMSSYSNCWERNPVGELVRDTIVTHETLIFGYLRHLAGF